MAGKGGGRRYRSVNISLSDELSALIEEIRARRRDPCRSDTVRYLILRALADMGYLEPEVRKALGVAAEEEVGEGGKK